MSPSAPLLHDAEELWLRLMWFCRVRWFVPVGLYAVERLAEMLLRSEFHHTAIAALLGLALVLNAGYTGLLRRWRPRLPERLPALRALAHVMVLADLTILIAAFALTGGTRTPFWPFVSLTVLSAALFFPRRAVFGYAGFAAGLFALLAAIEGSLQSLNLLLLTCLLGMTVAVAGYLASRLEQAHDAELALERLRSEKAAVEEIARHKEEIISLVSHELRNPLSALRGYVQLARRRPASSSGSPEKDTLARIDKQVSLMSRMVSDLYDLSSLEHGGIHLDRAPCDLAALVQDVVARFRTLHPTVSIVLHAPPALRVVLDAQRIDQLISNLVGNSVKYCGDAAQIELRVEAIDGAISLIVRDDGPGIAEDKLLKIFEPFERADEAGKPGLGLGLSLARQIARAHGGEIEAQSVLGKGTTMRVRLPMAAIAEQSPAAN